MDMRLIQQVEHRYMRKDALPDFRPGDIVRVVTKYFEGDKEKESVFEGVVIRRRGSGTSETFTVRRIGAHNVAIERTFFLHSPAILRLEVIRRQKVRRARLYYLRERKGKAARLKEDRVRAEADKARMKVAKSASEAEQAEAD
jgi:large subunit ribosomal protein L19